MFWLWMVVGCKKVEPAPAELDDLLHFLWQEYDAGEDERVAEGLVNLHSAVDGDGLGEAFDGSLSRLSTAEAELVGVTDRDPADAAGVFLVNVFPCDFELLTEVLSYRDQSELYEGVYDAYNRDFDQSRDGFLAAEHHRLEWDFQYTASLLGATYDADARGALRRVPDIDEETTPFGAFVVQRSFMPQPAVFEDGTNKSLPQDYQLEVYWPRGGGEILHAYALWREAEFGSGFSMEDEGTQRILLNNLLDWDSNTTTLCEEGLP